MGRREYHLSIFKASLAVIKNMELMRNKFFWGEAGDSKKIIWVKSSRLYGDFEVGGLKIGSLKAKNLALLGK